MKINKNTDINFRNIYDVTAYVQNHTLINRGITTIGGSTIPQCIMSNNKDEAQERATMGVLYFLASYLTPILLLPLYNKHFLKNQGITKSLNDLGNKIIEVPKRYLTKNANLYNGLVETSQNFDKKLNTNNHKKAFDEIYFRYNNQDKLKKDLLKVHEKVLATDYMTTAFMWSVLPWIATEATEKRTKRKDFSAGFNLKQEDKNQNNKEMSKIKKMISNLLLCIIPGILFSKAVTKGLSTDINKTNKTIIDKLLLKLTKNPDNFNYTSGTNMSKTIYAAIWMLSSFPAKIISARDKNERKDRILRDIGLFTMFFGGDFLINNILGRLADKFFKTKIMDYDKFQNKDLNFIQKFKLSIRNFKNLDNVPSIPKESLKKTKNIGASIYWLSLLSNTALIGFMLPKLLNKFLRNNIKKENEKNNSTLINININEFMKNTKRA